MAQVAQVQKVMSKGYNKECKAEVLAMEYTPAVWKPLWWLQDEDMN